MHHRVLRFEFSQELVQVVTAFANVHRYDDRKTYKEAWAQWMSGAEVADLFNAEVARLKALGYKGDAADKLFKSGRYYFRQKTYGPGNVVPRTPPPNLSLHTPPPNLSLHTDPKPLGVRGALVAPRKYVTMDRALLGAMDAHIERSMQSNPEYTPAIGFSEFCKTHAGDAVLTSEVARLFHRMVSKTDADAAKEIHEKLKKTYKNRYFMMVKNANANANANAN
jgi:hypothetical protein